jgi:hypothetical protein
LLKQSRYQPVSQVHKYDPSIFAISLDWLKPFLPLDPALLAIAEAQATSSGDLAVRSNAHEDAEDEDEDDDNGARRRKKRNDSHSKSKQLHQHAHNDDSNILARRLHDKSYSAQDRMLAAADTQRMSNEELFRHTIARLRRVRTLLQTYPASRLDIIQLALPLAAALLEYIPLGLLMYFFVRMIC